MKIVIIVGLVLILGGTGAILYANSAGGAYQRLDKFDRLFSEDSDGNRFGLEVNITRMQSKFKPLQFQGYRLFMKDETPSQNEPEITVIYDGDDHFELDRGSQVFVEGTWDFKNRTLNATKVSTQCPSHYEGEAASYKSTSE